MPLGGSSRVKPIGEFRRKSFHLRLPPSSAPGRAVRARYPNHVWLVDLTDVPGLFF